MRASVRTAAAFWLLSFSAHSSAGSPVLAAAQALPEPARAAAAAVDAFHAALSRGDAEAALALMADDALIFEDGRVERTKAEYAGHHAAADAAFSKATSSKRLNRTVRATADLAWIATESRTSGRFRGQDVDRMMVETMVLRRDRAGWRIVHIHWSSAAPSVE
ncbi:MAG: nuclear transport factor 2 family protein [Allosphingosinicella sp.]